MRKIYSLAWFRHDASHYEHPNCGESRGRFFLNFLRVAVRAFHACWAGGGWTLRIAHDDRVREFPYFRALETMNKAGLLELVYFGQSQTLCGLGGMMERLRPAFDPTVELVVCRDLDSLPMPKDRRAVEEFIASSKSVHVIHDGSSHSGVMGGTLAVKAVRFRDLIGCHTFDDLMWKTADRNMNEHGADQRLLNEALWPKIAKDTLVHELHHVTNMNAGEMRTRIDVQTPQDIAPDVAAYGDSFATGVGQIVDVEPPFAFYERRIGDGVLKCIQDCESEAR